MNPNKITSETTHGNLGLEKVLRDLALGQGIELLTGNVYICVKTTDPNYGDYLKRYQTTYENGQERVQTSLTTALSILGAYDTIILTPGNWSGNYETPLNATAPFCNLIGVDPTGSGKGPWLAPSSTASPIIDVRARGWRISGLEFEGMTGAAAIRVTKIAGLTQRCDFFKIDHCLFSGGKTGIEFNGGGTYWEISDNHFSLLTTAGGAAIYVGSSSYQIPALGYIFNNRFDNNVNHIYGGASRGFSDTVIEKNKLMLDGVAQDAAILLDIRGGGGGNMVVDNWFDITQAQWTDDDSTAFVRSNATDSGSGNHFSDGEQEDLMSV